MSLKKVDNMKAARAKLDELVGCARDRGAPHYKAMRIEPWDVIDTWSFEERVGFYRGNLLKYTMRMGSKDSCSEDIAKVEHYSQKLQEVLAERGL